MSEVGFDDGALFDTLARPKRTKVVREFDDAGNCISEVTTTQSWWDVIMITGGPVMIMAVVGLIKTLAAKTPDWFNEEEAGIIKDHPLAFLALGPVGFKLGYKKAKAAGKVAEWGNEYGAGFLLSQVAQNWGFTTGDGEKRDRPPGFTPDPSADPSNWVVDITLSTGETLRSFTGADGIKSTNWHDAGGNSISDSATALRLFKQAKAEGLY